MPYCKCCANTVSVWDSYNPETDTLTVRALGPKVGAVRMEVLVDLDAKSARELAEQLLANLPAKMDEE